MRAEVAAKKIPGAVLMVWRGGQPAFVAAVGQRDPARPTPMQVDDLFRIYSMTKSIVSVAAMMLVEEGKLELDAPVSKYLPALAAQKVGVESDRSLDNAAIVERVARLPLAYQPGSTWDYGVSTDVLGRIVEVVSGQPLGAFLKARLFDPLGMKDSTAPDYSRFRLMPRSGGQLDGRRYLAEATLKDTTRDQLGPQVARTALYLPGADYGFGLGFAVRIQPAAKGRDSAPGEYYGAASAAPTCGWTRPTTCSSCT